MTARDRLVIYWYVIFGFPPDAQFILLQGHLLQNGLFEFYYQL